METEEQVEDDQSGDFELVSEAAEVAGGLVARLHLANLSVTLVPPLAPQAQRLGRHLALRSITHRRGTRPPTQSSHRRRTSRPQPS